MTTRGQQFPLHNTGYFHGTLPEGPGEGGYNSAGTLHHESSHSIQWGAGAGAFSQPLRVTHTYNPTHQRGTIRLEGDQIGGPGGSREQVASLTYNLQHAERATSLRVQPVIHTEMIQVHDDYQGSGLASHMMSRLQQAHPGVSHPPSNHLSENGAEWRAHRVTRGLDTGERIGFGPWESDPAKTEHPRIFRPVEPEELDKPHEKLLSTKTWLMEPGHFDPHNVDREDMNHDDWVTRKSKIRKVWE